MNSSIILSRMESRRLSLTVEITMLSAENLSINGKPVTTKNTCVVVSTAAKLFYATWNDKLSLEFPMHEEASRFVMLEVRRKTWWGGVRSVGTAQVAVSDFVAFNLQFSSYRLWDGKGQRNGIINFSARVKENGFGIMQVPLMVENDDGSDRGVVTGVPVLWNNHPANIPR